MVNSRITKKIRTYSITPCLHHRVRCLQCAADVPADWNIQFPREARHCLLDHLICTATSTNILEY